MLKMKERKNVRGSWQWSRTWGVARLLGLRGIPPHPHSSKGRVAPPPSIVNGNVMLLELSSYRTEMLWA